MMEYYRADTRSVDCSSYRAYAKTRTLNRVRVICTKTKEDITRKNEWSKRGALQIHEVGAWQIWGTFQGAGLRV